MNKKKLVTAGVALATAAALMLGGTFAWQSINQTALNEASDIVNPGGRLHDDFNGTNKDIYVENFTAPNNGGEDIYARIRLEEYFEVVMNYNTAAQKTEVLVGEREVADENSVNTVEGEDGVTYERVYETKIIDAVDENGVVSAAVDGDSYSWWNWTTGREGSEEGVYYMPTFNLNKDSLEADINGVYADAVGGISDRNGTQQYDDTYHAYSDGETKEGYEIYDGDVNDSDELSINGADLNDIINNGTNEYPDNIVLTKNKVPHTATNVGATKGLISMSEWLDMRDYDEDGVLTNKADLAGYWVYDTDGWVYWSAPIPAGESTGLLLDGIELSGVMDDTWYYAINVVAQFVTADDVGKTDGTGFYDTTKGDTVPSSYAEELLTAIGVDMSGEDAGGEVTKSLTLDADNGGSVTAAVNEGIEISMDDTNATHNPDSDSLKITYTDDAGDEIVLEADADYTYSDDVLTIINPNLAGKELTVEDGNGAVSGTVTVTDAASGEEGDSTETELQTLVLTPEADNTLSMMYGSAVVKVTNSNGTIPDTVYVGSEAWNEDSDWSYDPETGTLTLNVVGHISISDAPSGDDSEWGSVIVNLPMAATLTAADGTDLTDNGDGSYTLVTDGAVDLTMNAGKITLTDGTEVDPESGFTFYYGEETNDVTCTWEGMSGDNTVLLLADGTEVASFNYDPDLDSSKLTVTPADAGYTMKIRFEGRTSGEYPAVGWVTLTVVPASGSTDPEIPENPDAPDTPDGSETEPETTNPENPNNPEDTETTTTTTEYTVAQGGTLDMSGWDKTSDAVITRTYEAGGEEPIAMSACEVQFYVNDQWVTGTSETDYEATGTHEMTIYAAGQLSSATEAKVTYNGNTVYSIKLTSSGVFN